MADPTDDDLAPQEYDDAGVPVLASAGTLSTPAQESAQARRGDVQRLLALGCTPAEVAKRLGIARGTVTNDLAIIRHHNRARMEGLKPSDLFGDVDAAYKHILRRTMDLADNADGAEDELKALAEARKTIVAQMAAYKQLGIDRDIEAESRAAAVRPPLHIEHVHRVQLPDNVRRMVVQAALESTLTSSLAAPTPDDAIDCTAIEAPKAK